MLNLSVVSDSRVCVNELSQSPFSQVHELLHQLKPLTLPYTDIDQDLRAIDPENQKLSQNLNNTNYTKLYTLFGLIFLFVGAFLVI